MGEMNFSGQIQFFFLNNFILSLKIVNILQMNNDDEKNQIDLLKVKNRENRVALFGDFRSENCTFGSKSKI